MTRSSSPRSSRPMRSSSPPGTHSTWAWIDCAKSSTRRTSVPSGSSPVPPGRSVHGGFGETPTRSIPPVTRSSVPSGSVGIVTEHPPRASRSTAAPAIILATELVNPHFRPAALGGLSEIGGYLRRRRGARRRGSGGTGWLGPPLRVQVGGAHVVPGTGTPLVRHVVESRVVTLERHGDRVGGAVAVLGHDDVGLTGTGVLVVGVLAVQEHHHVGVLLEAVVHGDPVGNEVVVPGNRRIVNRLATFRSDRNNAIPQEVVDREHIELFTVEHLGDSRHASTRRGRLEQGAPAVLGADCLLKLPVGGTTFGQDPADVGPDLKRQGVDVGVRLDVLDPGEELVGRLT